MDVMPPFVAYGAARCADDQRRQYLSEYASVLGALEETAPLTLDASQLSYEV
jgi:hypothetical protein